MLDCGSYITQSDIVRYAYKYLLLLVLVITISSCYSIDSYQGHGNLVDNGFRLKGGRYNLTLLEIPLDQSKRYEFYISNLPPEYLFTTGIYVLNSIENVKAIETNIKLELYTDAGEEVISVAAPLNKWTLSHSHGAQNVYAYMRGKSYDRPLRGNLTQPIPIYTGVDCGVGTYFIPKKKGAYTLVVTTTATEKRTNQKVFIKLRDAGQNKKCVESYN
ncbi:MAG: hypothetical protein L3J83_03305 [Proteobacteria bacterium]|nr:hypothetical protein [Pseudomonadota bacterium]